MNRKTLAAMSAVVAAAALVPSSAHAARAAPTVTVQEAAQQASTATVWGAAQQASTATAQGAAQQATTATVRGAAQQATTATMRGAAQQASTATAQGAAQQATTATVRGAAQQAPTATVQQATQQAPTASPQQARSQAQQQTRARAMWLWSQADPAAVVAWADRQGVREIFAAVSWQPSSAEVARLRELRARTRAAGIRLSALGGDPSWAVAPGDAVAWRQRVSALRLFDGVHLDVEPYLLPAWGRDQPAIAASYLTMLDAVRRAGPEPLEADVPFWLATVKSGAKNLAEEVMARVDAITVLSYRDSAAAVLGVGTDLLTRAQATRKPVRLAAETQATADCAYCTFAGQTQARIRQQLGRIDAGAQAYGTYQGVAVHDYDAWSRIG